MTVLVMAFLDTNIILDVLLERQPWYAAAASLWAALREGKVACLVSASSITDIYYISDQHLRRRPSADRDARGIVRECLDHLTIVEVSRGHLERAYEIGGEDFEDDLQYACAEACRAEVIVTRDPAGFCETAIPVFSPEAFVEHLIRIGATSPAAGGPTP